MGTVLLVRHGQASFGAADYDLLSEAGHEQSRQLGAWLGARGIAPSVLLRGGMRRHEQTTEALATSAGWASSPAVDRDWDEFDHLGVLGALHRSGEVTPPDPEAPTDMRAFQRHFELAIRRWAAGAHDADYPESFGDFVARVRAALARACAGAGPGRTVVVVSSGGPIAVACALLADPAADAEGLARLWERFDSVLANSSLTRVLVGANGTRLLTFNEHPHLDASSVTYW